MQFETKRRPRSVVFIPEDEADIFFGSARPRLSREDCPSDELLGALARRERPIGDPAYEHLTTCPKCYREFRALQQAVQGRGNAFTRYKHLLQQRRSTR